ncbi:MAG: MFS transporter, partial [Chromatiales bacterium]|nr:MFS transporter [Chromatiales bacterium]
MSAADNQTEERVVEPGGLRFGPLTMNPGIRPKHLFALFFASFFGIASMSFINSSSGYLLTEVIGVPLDEQGSVAGNLTIIQEIVLLCLLGPIGAMSDKWGRKPLYVSAFILMSFAYVIYPLAASLLMLYLFRPLFAAGCAGNIVMLPTVANDYPQEQCRAKMLATCFMFNGLGLVVLILVMKDMPYRFQGMGIDPKTAGIYWFWIMAGVTLIVATVLFLFLKPGAPQQLEKRDKLLTTFRVGLKAAKNPRIALAYAAAGVSRGDLSVMSTFFSLWLFQVGVDQGLTTAEAIGKAGTFYAFVQAVSLPVAPLAGWLLDRIDRVLGIAIAMAIAGISYGSLWFLDEPLGNAMYICAALIGAAEMFANLSATSLIGKEAPERGRGAVLGMWSWCGALGILIVAQVGGY